MHDKPIIDCNPQCSIVARHHSLQGLSFSTYCHAITYRNLHLQIWEMILSCPELDYRNTCTFEHTMLMLTRSSIIKILLKFLMLTVFESFTCPWQHLDRKYVYCGDFLWNLRILYQRISNFSMPKDIVHHYNSSNSYLWKRDDEELLVSRLWNKSQFLNYVTMWW